MATIRQWDKNIEDMKREDREEVLKAIETLKNKFPMLIKEFDGYCLSTIFNMVEVIHKYNKEA